MNLFGIVCMALLAGALGGFFAAMWVAGEPDGDWNEVRRWLHNHDHDKEQDSPE